MKKDDDDIQIDAKEAAKFLATVTDEDARRMYIDNVEFSQQMHLHATSDTETVSDYIAKCFLGIAKGLASRPNFSRYPFVDDMIMDGVVDCLKAANNYDIDAYTRKGKPNAFGYFTQICYYAFLRRIAKEKRQVEVRNKLINEGSVGTFMDMDDDGTISNDVYSRSMSHRKLLTIDDFYKQDTSSLDSEIKELTKGRRGRPRKYPKKPAKIPGQGRQYTSHSPEIRAKISERMLAAHARRRAAKEAAKAMENNGS